MTLISFLPIGLIHTPRTEMSGVTVQSVATAGIAGTVEVAPEYAPGLRDLDGFSHLISLYHLHRVTGYALDLTRYLET